MENTFSNAAVSAMKRMSAIAAENGISDLTLDEINAEIDETRTKMRVYESIIAGLTEAVEDSRSEQKALKRHTMEISDGALFKDQQKFLHIPIPATE